MALTPAEKQKRYRERRRLNAEKEEENKRKDRERGRKRVSIKEMSARAQRAQRKCWRFNQRKCRQNKAKEIVELCTTPDVQLQSSAKRAGRKRVLRNRSKVVKENIQLRNEIKILKFKADMYRKRWSRAKLKVEENAKTSNSPRSKARRSLNDSFKVQLTPSKAKVVRQLTLFNTFSSCLKEKYSKSTKNEKRYLHNLILNSCLKKYRLLRAGQNSYFGCRIYQKPKSNKENIKVKCQLVTKFFLQDDVSRASAGKKETVTLNKIKMQKRYLLDSMKNLYKKFVKENNFIKISYTSFTRFRPFYVCAPAINGRNTCMCIIHENISLKAQALHRLKIINTSDLNELVKTLPCDENNKYCMYNTCDNCKGRHVQTNSYKLTDKIKWQIWSHKFEEREKTINDDRKRFITRVISKEIMETSISELMIKFNLDMCKFKKHVFNIRQQYIAYRDCKENIQNNEAVLHIDFSENYMCKLATEIQAYHFGSSRKQAVLHTGVLYLKKLLEPISFCSISECYDHGPAAIWAHLQPILNEIKRISPEVEILHFFSDGPTTQYRQKKNFFLLNKYISDNGLKYGSWSFFEAGHGKGAADGIGGVIKRTADRIVAQGTDIPDAKTLLTVLTNKTNIQLYYITETDIETFRKLIPLNIPVLKGTMRLHQIFSLGTDRMLFRDLSCFCRQKIICECFKVNYFILKETEAHETTMQSLNTKSFELKQDLLENNCRSSHGDLSNNFPIRDNIQEGNFVLVKLEGKRSIKYFVSEITSIQENYFTVKYLKKVRNNTKFYREDNKEYDIEIDDIIMKLPNPNLTGCSIRQLQYLTFDIDLTKYDVE